MKHPHTAPHGAFDVPALWHAHAGHSAEYGRSWGLRPQTPTWLHVRKLTLRHAQGAAPSPTPGTVPPRGTDLFAIEQNNEKGGPPPQASPFYALVKGRAAHCCFCVHSASTPSLCAKGQPLTGGQEPCLQSGGGPANLRVPTKEQTT